ncbi:YybH family protein [Pirellulaceae bacterium SH449]
MRFLLLSFFATLVLYSTISRTGGFVHAQSASTNPTANSPLVDSPVAEALVARELTPLEKEMLEETDKLVTAFNKGDIKGIVNTFLSDGELIDERGVVHSGQEQISSLMVSFFENYPNVSTEAELESVRQVAGIVFADGRRSIATADGTSVTLLRFNSVWQKTDAGYKLASFRDYSEPSSLTPNEALQELQWLIGDWVNEGDDATVRLSFKWSADTNFILGDYSLKTVDGDLSTSTQRIGWDALQGAFRSWTFDVDGGFGEGTWTRTVNGWRVRSSAVTPEGTTASAILLLTPVSEDRFSINGSNRIANEESLPDYEIFVVKRPPPALKK